MQLNNVLVLYKRSAYKTFVLNAGDSFEGKKRSFLNKEMNRFKYAHDCHYEALEKVLKILKNYNINFKKFYRGRNVNFKKFDLIITVGGDGTFLEAARNLTSQIIIGVNSVPSLSVGNFCTANAENFEKILKLTLSKKSKINLLHRLRLDFDDNRKPIDALNDILICHRNPAMLCRYYMNIGTKTEEQRSSGIWISTPAGSTGAIKSAGGKIVNAFDKSFQYKPRELYQGLLDKYILNGSVLSSKQKMELTSMMSKGKIYVDGAHHDYHFDYGDSISIKLSPNPIKTVTLK
jgi:NAD+ kinase